MTEKQIHKLLSEEIPRYSIWKDYFNHLKAFQKKYKHTWIPQNSRGRKDKSVAIWASHQRTLIREGHIHHLKLKLLQSINFKIDYYDFADKISLSVRNERSAKKTSFDVQLKLVVQWKHKHGEWPRYRHTNITKLEKCLGSVVAGWRLKGKLYSEQMDILGSHGFIWSLDKQNFLKKIARIKAFKKKFKGYYIDSSKGITDYDRETSNLISVLRTKPPKKEWMLKVVNELEIGKINSKYD